MTTLSVVPACLEYACGHAALVSLPRVKGETPRQRNERVNNEKAAAGQRSCDFCAPSTPPIVGANDLFGGGVGVGVGLVASAPAVTGAIIKGTHLAALKRGVNDDRLRDEQQEEAMTTATTEPSTGPDQAPSTPASTRLEGVFPVRKLSDKQEREITVCTPKRLLLWARSDSVLESGTRRWHASLRAWSRSAQPKHQPCNGIR